jgi:hypothetical protein
MAISQEMQEILMRLKYDDEENLVDVCIVGVIFFRFVPSHSL